MKNLKTTAVQLASTHGQGAKTIVMKRPPDMTIVLDHELRKQSAKPLRSTHVASPHALSGRATTVFRRGQAPPPPAPSRRPLRSAPPPPPSPAALRPAPPPRTAAPSLDTLLPVLPPAPPPKRAKPAPAPTRMVSFQQAFADALPPLPRPQAPPPGLALAPPPPPPPLSPPRRLHLKETLRPRLAIVGALLALLLLLLVIPWGEADAVAKAQAPAPEKTAIAAPASEALASAPVDAQPAPSEEQAGAMLLAGHRAEALELYRRLAREPGASEGLEAMVIVLSQKVQP